MQLLLLLLISIVLLLAGYFIYGAFLSRMLGLRNNFKTPAHEFCDNVDFVPTNKFYLLGQHLSAIAAAGPIIGPILAGIWFGWLPVVIWIIFGGIFIGGVHDMAALAASVRQKGKSIAEVIKENMNQRSYVLFLLFIWFSLVYIITAFTDITASTFIEPQRGAGVASSSIMYLGLAFIMGIVARKFKPALSWATLIFIPFIFLSIYLGPKFPLTIPSFFGFNQRASWNILLLIYCFAASVIPVWLLLQPRGYLGGFFLSATALAAFAGIIVGSFTRKLLILQPAFTGWVNSGGLPLLPILFTTVACGACSGFHAIVSSGTTSKQIDRETDSKLIGFGGMLLESFVALIALSTLLIISTSQSQKLNDPNQIYANGIAVFLNSLGINREFALNFALLAFATFVYDTLDVATRLGRYVFQELIGWKGKAGSYLAAFLTLFLPGIALTRKIIDSQGNIVPAWRAFWTIFGSSNQLMAALTLLGLSVWLFRKKSKFFITLLPAVFMSLIAVLSLVFVLRPWVKGMVLSRRLNLDPMAVTGCVLLVLAFLLLYESLKIFLKKDPFSGGFSEK